jgi:hypothetical protein
MLICVTTSRRVFLSDRQCWGFLRVLISASDSSMITERLSLSPAQQDYDLRTFRSSDSPATEPRSHITAAARCSLHRHRGSPGLARLPPCQVAARLRLSHRHSLPPRPASRMDLSTSKAGPRQPGVCALLSAGAALSLSLVAAQPGFTHGGAAPPGFTHGSEYQ